MNADWAIQRRHPRSEVGFTEALHVCAELGVREGRHAQWLAEALGLAWKEPSGAAAGASGPAKESAAAAAAAAADPSVQKERKKLKLLASDGREPMAFEQLFEAQADEVRRAVELRPATFAAGEERPPFQALFLERWFQGIFTAVLSTQVPSREVDFRMLERSVIEGEVLAQMPFKRRGSLVKGVHVLLDRSESMQPFWRDETELVARLRRLLGDALVQHTWFEYDPMRPGESALSWHTPKPRQFREETPVLMVTDFGGGLDPRTACTMEWEPWLPLLQLAESGRCRVFALVPAARNFWPAGLGQFFDGSLLWDRETSPHTAARLCQR